MKRKRSTSVRLTTGLFIGLIFSLSAVLLYAQESLASGAGQGFAPAGFGPAYDTGHEITVGGSIHEIVTKHEIGAPAGMHLLVSAPQGVVDVHLGSFLSAETKSALLVGAPVEILGAMNSLRGKNYLLARQITVGGRTIKIRSARGLPMLDSSGAHERRSAKRIGDDAKGGSL